MTTTEALKLALDALDEFCELGAIIRPLEVRDALREALAEPTSAEYAMGYAEGFNDACKPALHLPDKLVYDGYETPQYIEGWNDCRECMKGMK